MPSPSDRSAGFSIHEFLQLLDRPGISRDIHKGSDADKGPHSQHHSLGKRPNQAAPGNHSHSKVKDTGWMNINLASGFTTTAAGNEPQACVRLGIVYLRGYVKPTSGSFAANTAYTIAGVGGMPLGSRSEKQSETTRSIAGSNPAGQVKGYVDPDGSVVINTDSTAQVYVVLSDLSGYLAYQ